MKASSNKQCCFGIFSTWNTSEMKAFLSRSLPVWVFGMNRLSYGTFSCLKGRQNRITCQAVTVTCVFLKNVGHF